MKAYLPSFTLGVFSLAQAEEMTHQEAIRKEQTKSREACKKDVPSKINSILMTSDMHFTQHS
jgi:hypothetical protein